MGGTNGVVFKAVIVIASVFLSFSLVHIISVDSGGMKYLETGEGSVTVPSVYKEVVPLGDFDQDGFEDLALAMPGRNSNGLDAGSVAIFWGSDEGFPPLDIENADLVIHGDTYSLFGQSVAAWDYSGNGWLDLVISAPNAGNGTGVVYIFDSTDVNGASSGSIFTYEWSDMELTAPDTYFFGSNIEVGGMTEDDLDDLMVLSVGNSIHPTKAQLYSGGVLPEFPYEILLDNGSVNNRTRTLTLDLYGTGVGSFIYSSPDRGAVTIVQMNIFFDRYQLPGANSTGVVDFEGSINETGDTWGRGAGDDGWDTSPYHVYDTDSGALFVRWNEATGNPRGHDRSVENINKLFIEVGGDQGSSYGADQSGAYGVSFQLSSENLTGMNSAILSFDYEWEDWGFETNERIWIKARLTDPSNVVTWLGKDKDSTPSPDATTEIFTLKGKNSGSVGVNMFGSGTFQTDVLTYINGPGEYYLDMGGKISRWTQSTEFGGFGFDNISLVFKTLSHDIKTLTGAGQLGTDLEGVDVGGDGHPDLVVSSPLDGRIRIFNGSEPYWSDKALNQGMANYTIEGTAGTDLGYRLLRGDPSPFTLNESLMITELQRSEEGVGTGAVHLFELPLGSSLLTLDDAHEMNMAPAGITDLGMDLLNIGDQDGNGYPEILFFGWNATNKLMFIRADNSPSPSRLWIDNPKRHAVVSGDVEIRARIFDIDGDAGPENIRFYRSSDNRSWSPIGDGRPDRIEGDTAIKDWPTRLYENTGYFFKVQSTDGFGLTTVLYTDRVDVMNHAPPFVDLVFPRDNAELRGIEDISARITLPSDEELQPPVRFFYSRDNSTWTEFANSSSPSGGSEIDHVVHLDTEDLEDGPIWFRVNATTLFGLGREDRNLEPALINNFYPPQVNLTFPIANTTIEGFVNVTANVSDPDDDLKEPVTFNIKSTDEGLYDLVANMTAIGNGTYFYNWDTTSVVNGWYDLMVLAKDTTFMQSTGLLNSSIYIRNRYSPSATLIRPEPGDVLSGLSILRATVTDKDLNFRVRDIVFEYSNAGENIWTSMDRPILKGSSAEVTWDTTAIMNGLYDIRVSVTDDDDLTSVSRVDGVRVKNPFEPVIMPDLPRFTDPISGVVRLSFNVSDDEPLPPGSVKVEVKYIGTWIELEGLVRATTGGTFTPGSNISYYIDWDTAKIDEVGSRVFPDGVGYDVRITVTDSDNLISVFVPSYSYEVKNKQESTDDDVDGNDFGLSGFAIALIALGAILLLVFIFLFFIMRSGRNKEKDVPLFDTSRMQKEKPTPPPDEEATPEAGDMYSPGGWGAPEPAQAVPLDDTMFSAGSDIGDLGLDLGVTEEKDLSDISDPFFPKEKKAVKRTVAKPVIDLEDEVEVDLPEGVMPSGSEDEVDEWDDEGDEWEDEDDWEELEEDDWEELEEDGSGDPSDIQDEDLEDDEDVFIVTCKCGEEIEIPSDFKGSKFRCPECGKKGRIPER